jgi:hypothetical protein
LNDILQQLAAESGNAPPPGASSASNAMAGDLAAMLQQLAESGDTASAAALLQKMQALMERLRGGAPSPEQLAAQQAAQEIRALQQNQQQLLQQLRSGGAPLDTLQPAQQAISDGLRAVQQRLAEAELEHKVQNLRFEETTVKRPRHISAQKTFCASDGPFKSV